jgi:hypothetical protein
LFATNINKEIAVDATKVYDVVATLKNATAAANLGTSFKFILLTGGFESLNGAVINTSPLNVVVSSVIELVKAKPTVSYVSSQKGGNAVYKFRIASNGGDLKLSELKIDIANNTSAATSTGTLYLGNEG